MSYQTQMQPAKKALEDAAKPVDRETDGVPSDESDTPANQKPRLPRTPYHVSYSRYLRNREQGLFSDRIAVVGFVPSDYVSGEALVTAIHSLMHKYVIEKDVSICHIRILPLSIM